MSLRTEFNSYLEIKHNRLIQQHEKYNIIMYKSGTCLLSSRPEGNFSRFLSNTITGSTGFSHLNVEAGSSSNADLTQTGVTHYIN